MKALTPTGKRRASCEQASIRLQGSPLGIRAFLGQFRGNVA